MSSASPDAADGYMATPAEIVTAARSPPRTSTATVSTARRRRSASSYPCVSSPRMSTANSSPP